MLRMPRLIEAALAVILLELHAVPLACPDFTGCHRCGGFMLCTMRTWTWMRLQRCGFILASFALSVPWRAAQIVLIGVSPGAYAFSGQTALFLSILFHHSNVLGLPLSAERRLNWVHRDAANARNPPLCD